MSFGSKRRLRYLAETAGVPPQRHPGTGGRRENALADARLRYSDDHPDVRQQVRSLAALEQQLSNALSQQRAYSAPVALSPEARQLQLQIDAANSDIAQFSRRRAELSARLDELQNAVARLPEASREYTALNQDYELASERYNEALKNLDEARMAERLETGGAAERFTLIGNAQVPANPYKPNRTAILLLVIVLGLGGGMILATFLDTLDDTGERRQGGLPARRRAGAGCRALPRNAARAAISSHAELRDDRAAGCEHDHRCDHLADRGSIIRTSRKN